MSEKGQGVEIQIGEGLALDQAGDEVVIDVRGDFILDSNGETVDANAVGAPSSPGEGTPGAPAGRRPLDEREPSS